MVVPAALKVLRIKPNRAVTQLGALAGRVGWTKGDVVARLEDKRREKAQVYYEKKKQAETARSKALSSDKELKKIQQFLIMSCWRTSFPVRAVFSSLPHVKCSQLPND